MKPTEFKGKETMSYNKAEQPLPPAEGAEDIRQLLLGWEHYKRDHLRESEALDVEAILLSEYSQIAAQPQPTAEGAEEILEDIAMRIDASGVGNNRDAIKRFYRDKLNTLATLHAQRIAEKMVEERLRKELIAYDKWLNRTRWGMREVLSPEKAVDRYLKSKEQ